ncbi:MAG: hypothetical protein RMK65_06245, partial [Anaerolineae bacterium]|nr:hypothetical protein [Anaerolineae bacterium]
HGVPGKADFQSAPTQVALAWASGPPVGLRRPTIGRQRRLTLGTEGPGKADFQSAPTQVARAWASGLPVGLRRPPSGVSEG